MKLLILALIATPISEHQTKTCGPVVDGFRTCTTSVQNHQNYKDAAGSFHVAESSVSEAGGYALGGTTFKYRKRARLTFYAGEEGLPSNRTKVGVQVTHEPAAWMTVKFVGAATSPIIKHDGRTLRWDDVLPNVDLYIRGTRTGIKGRCIVSGTPGQGYMEFEYVMPKEATIASVSDGWELGLGGETFGISKGLVWDSDNGDVFNLGFEGVPISSTTTVTSNVVDADHRTVVLRITPDAGEVQASLTAQKTVFVKMP